VEIFSIERSMSSRRSRGVRLDIPEILHDGFEASLAQGPTRHKVDTHSEDCLQLVSQIYKCKPEWTFKLNQNVDIALRALLLANKRPEHSDTSDAIPLRQRRPVRAEYIHYLVQREHLSNLQINILARENDVNRPFDSIFW
jgi:hypothetical protein